MPKGETVRRWHVNRKTTSRTDFMGILVQIVDSARHETDQIHPQAASCNKQTGVRYAEPEPAQIIPTV
eukprot:749800-Hanusia_phi.AAC.2